MGSARKGQRVTFIHNLFKIDLVLKIVKRLNKKVDLWEEK